MDGERDAGDEAELLFEDERAQCEDEVSVDRCAE